jgi:hypothetical protein
MRDTRRRQQREARNLGAPPVADRSREAMIGRCIEPQSDGCWLFRNRPDEYGTLRIAGAYFVAHRWVYEMLHDDIPDGHVLHHECETKGCVNPAHLTPMTPGDHARHHAQEHNFGRDH